MPKRILLLASGTRGDVQPYIALGLGLQSAGYQVSLATHARFQPLTERYGLGTSLLEGNPSELLMQSGWESALAFKADWGRGLRASLQFTRAARPMYERMLASAWNSCQGADALVAGLPTIWGAHISEALNIPCILCFLQPLTRTGEFPSPLFPYRRSFGRSYNHLSYRIIEQVLWQPWRALINRWRRDQLHLHPAPMRGIHHRLYTDTTPVIYAFSERVVPRPKDWPAWHQTVGYWFLEEGDSYSPPQDLKRYIEAGDPPVYIGLGSTGVHKSDDVLALLSRALDGTNLRAVLAIPSAPDLGLNQRRSIFTVREVSHAWLFPRMAALVHHGGAGTTASGLRAGIPAFIMPQYADQFFWGERLFELGVGPRPLPLRSLSAERLAHSLERMIRDTKLSESARKFSQAISTETGIKRAVDVIQQAL